MLAIKEQAPDAQAEVLAYSDWLEEQGRLQEAEQVRQAKAVEARDQDYGKVRCMVLRVWNKDPMYHAPKHHITEVMEVRKVVSPRTLRRKLQKKLHRKQGTRCSTCGEKHDWRLNENHGSRWELIRECSCGWQRVEWTGKPNKRKEPERDVAAMGELLPVLQE